MDDEYDADTRPAAGKFTATTWAFWSLVNANWTPKERDDLRNEGNTIEALWQKGA